MYVNFSYYLSLIIIFVDYQKINDYLMHLIENFNEEESSFKSLREKYEYIQNERKVIFNPNIITSYLNMNHINFDYIKYAANLKISETVAKQ